MTRIFLTLLCAIRFSLLAMGQNNEVDISIKETLLASGITHYIRLTDNVAYFKFRRYDKPSYFTHFDTLIRQSDTLYRSTTKDLIIRDKYYCLIIKGISEKRNKIAFHVATEQELRRWNHAHNIDTIYMYWKKIKEKEFYYLNHNKESYQDMKKSLDRLFSLTEELNPEDFKIELERYLKKYIET